MRSTRPTTATIILVVRADGTSVVASLPLEPGEEPGMNRCLVWNRRLATEEFDAATEEKLIELLGPPDERTHFASVFPVEP